MIHRTNSETNQSPLTLVDLIQLIAAILILLVITAVLGGFTVSESVNALNNSNCTAALSSTDGGINSPSANLGSPLLAITGVIYGAMFLLYAIGMLVILLVLCCGLLCATRQWESN